MSSMYIDSERLNQVMRWFVNYVTTQQGNSDISFNHGWLKETEGYKYEIYDNAHNSLNCSLWDKDMIGTGRILSCVIEGFNKKSNKNFNNIVQFQGLTYFKSKAEGNLKKSEDILFRLFTSDDPSIAFDDACLFWGRRFPELSYLLFMKDREKYLPVKTDRHRACLSKIGVDTTFLKSCSWSNYTIFLEIHREIQAKLEEYLGMDINLLDAHSFVWVAQKASDDLSNYDESLSRELSENNDPFSSTVVIAQKEGRVSYHYVTKYERNSNNRASAIRIHGCKCMACGFDFKKMYGDIGKGFIEVHHVKPLHSLIEEVEINPKDDLICLCANCHRMVHKKRGAVLSLEQLKNILKNGPY